MYKRQGLNFTALKSYFYNLRVQEYDKLYANVRSGLLAKDRETLLKRYQSKVENLQLNMLNSTCLLYTSLPDLANC